MAVLELNALSVALSGSFSATVIMPENSNMQAEPEKRYPALYFLHDIGGNDTDIRTVKNLEKLAAQLGMFIIAPTVMHSFAVNLRWGGKYGTFVSKELPEICQHLFPLEPQRKYVGGTGYGAYAAYLQAAENPDVFEKCIAINGQFDVVAMCSAAAAGKEVPHLDAPMLEAVFGSLNDVKESRFDIFSSNHTVPQSIFIACEDEHEWYEENAALAQRLNTGLHTGQNEDDLYLASLQWLTV